MDVQEWAGYRREFPGLSRFGVFIAASVALHVITIVGYGPAGIASAPYTGPATTFLDATLTRAEIRAPEATGADVPPQSIEQTTLPPPDLAANAQPRAGTPTGLDLPFPDKWFTAQEVDVRAEPLGEVFLDYPFDLIGTGASGRVQLLLFIDERGVVRKAQVASAVPKGVFDKYALNTWQEVRFSPALKAAVPVKSQKLVEVSFTPF